MKKTSICEEDSVYYNCIKTTIVFILSVFCVLITTLFIRYSLPLFGIDFINFEAIQNFNLLISDFNPEKTEQLMYYAGMISFAVFYTIFYKFLNLKQLQFSSNIYIFINFISIIFWLTLAGILAFNIDKDAYSLLNLGIKNSGTYIFCAFLLLPFVFYNPKSTVKKILINTTIFIFSTYIFFITSKLYYTTVFDFSNSAIVHVTSYFSPIYKVYSGQTAGIDFTNLYGFYPYIYNLFFKFMHNFSIELFSKINTFLTLLSLMCAGLFFWTNIKNKALAFLFFTCYTYMFYYANLFATATVYYFQYNPHRILFLSIIIALASIYIKIKNKTADIVLQILGYAISVISIVWNTETGLIVTAGWSLFLLYRYICKALKKEQFCIKTAAIYAAAPFVCLITAFILIEILIFCHSGNPINILKNLSFISLFYKTGYFLLPIQPISHPWMLVTGIYFIAIGASIRGLLYARNQEDDIINENSLYLLLAIAGAGIFVYYQGRSYIHSLISVSFPAIMLLAMFCNNFLETHNTEKLTKIFAKIKLILILLPVVYFSASCIFCSVFQYPVKYLDNQKQQLALNGNTASNYKFIKQAVPSNNTEIDILTLDSSLLYAMLNRKDNTKFNTCIDLAHKDDYTKVFEYLNSSNNPLFVDSCFYSSLKMYEPQKFHNLMSKKQYEIKQLDDYIVYLEPTR